MILYITRMGIGLDPDSTTYIGTARSILLGRGISAPFTAYSDPRDFAPMTHFPPLYPLFLASLGLLGLDPQAAARILGALLFSLNVTLVGTIAYLYTRHRLLATTAAFLAFFSSDMLVAHSMAWSEPLFIFLTLITVFLLTKYMESQGILYLLTASLAASLGILCRYVGVSWVVAGAVISLLGRNRPVSQKLKHLGMFLACSLFLTAPWFLRNLLVFGGAMDRPIVFHPVSLPTLLNGLHTVGKWLLPAIVSGPVFGGGIIIGLMLTTLLALRAASPKYRGLLYVLSSFICTYGLFLLASISFVDYYTPLDERILAPAYVLAVLLALCALYTLANSPMFKPVWESRLWNSSALWIAGSILLIGGGIVADLAGFGGRSGLGTKQLSLILLGIIGLVRVAAGKRWAERIPILPVARAVVLVLFLAWFAYPGLDRVIHVDDGQGFAAQMWQNSSVISAVQNYEVPIYSNGYDVIYILTGKPTKIPPLRFIPQTDRPNPHFYLELQAFEAELRKTGGVLVFVDHLDRDYLPSEQEFQSLSLQLVQDLPDGRIYQALGKRP